MVKARPAERDYRIGRRQQRVGLLLQGEYFGGVVACVRVSVPWVPQLELIFGILAQPQDEHKTPNGCELNGAAQLLRA